MADLAFAWLVVKHLKSNAWCAGASWSAPAPGK
jgi:AICAR transformylase/IMP cyclohydrolase PurH